MLDFRLEQGGPNLDLRWYFTLHTWNPVSSKFNGNFITDLSEAKFYFASLLLLRYCQHESNLDCERRWGLGTNCFWPFSFRNITMTISSFVPVAPNTYQKKYVLWVTINFISRHFILLWEPGFQVVWFIGQVYLGRCCLLFSLLSNPKQRALQGYIKN